MVTTDRKTFKVQLNHPSTKKLFSTSLYIVALLAAISNLAFWCSNSVASTIDNTPRDAMKYFFHTSFKDMEEELQNAIDEKKSGIFIMFSDKDCPWCEKMKSTVLNRPNVQKYYRQHFRLLTIDVRSGNMMTNFDGSELSEMDFAFKQHRVRATPVFMFFDTNGKITMRLTGITRNVEEFLWLGEFVVSGEYKKTNFTKYKRQRASQNKTKSGNNSL